MGWRAVWAVCICGVVGALVAVGCGSYASVEPERGYFAEATYGEEDHTAGAGEAGRRGEGVGLPAGFSTAYEHPVADILEEIDLLADGAAEAESPRVKELERELAHQNYVLSRIREKGVPIEGIIYGETVSPPSAEPTARPGGGPSTPAGPPERRPQAPKAAPARAARLVIYNANTYLVVQKISETLDAVTKIATEAGGYMQQMSASSVTVKVPAPVFLKTLDRIRALGETVRTDVTGTDVTEKMRDLQIRLDNAEEVRRRMVKLLERCDKAEEALKIEKELARLTEKIELLKGRLRFIANSVAFSTVTVHLNSPVPQTAPRPWMPFRWVSALGGELGAPPSRRGYAYPGRSRSRLRFELPENYVRYRSDRDSVRAMSADRVEVRVTRHDNYDGGGREFWAKLIRNELVAARSLAVSDEKEIELKTGATASLIVGAKEIGGKGYGYLVAVAANRRDVYAYEAWGPTEALAADRGKIEASVVSLAVRP